MWIGAMDGGRFAMGAVTLYLDTDGDAQMTAGEPMLGGTEDVVLYYNDADYTFGDTALSPGFHTLRFSGGCPESGPTLSVDSEEVDLYLSDSGGYVPLMGCPPP